MKVDVEGIDVEIEGVERDDLPDAFDFSEMWKLASSGESVESMAKHVHAQRWVESSRDDKFWDSWVHTSSV